MKFDNNLPTEELIKIFEMEKKINEMQVELSNLKIAAFLKGRGAKKKHWCNVWKELGVYESYFEATKKSYREV